MYTTTSKQQGTVNRGEVLRACFGHIQRSIRIEFVFIIILCDVTDYRLLYGNCSTSFSPRSKKILI